MIFFFCGFAVCYLFRNQYWIIDLLLDSGRSKVPEGSIAFNLTMDQIMELPHTVNLIPLSQEESYEFHFNLTGLPFYHEVRDRLARETMVLPGVVLMEPTDEVTTTTTAAPIPAPPTEQHSATNQAVLWVFGVLGFGGVLRIGMLSELFPFVLCLWKWDEGYLKFF